MDISASVAFVELYSEYLYAGSSDAARLYWCHEIVCKSLERLDSSVEVLRHMSQMLRIHEGRNKDTLHVVSDGILIR